MKRIVFALVVAAATLSCHETLAPIDTDIARFRVANTTLSITNLGDPTVYYFVADRNALALLDWVPCTDPSQCTGIGAHGSVDISFSRIAGYQSGDAEAVAYTWRLVPANTFSGFAPDSMRSTVIALK